MTSLIRTILMLGISTLLYACKGDKKTTVIFDGLYYQDKNNNISHFLFVDKGKLLSINKQDSIEMLNINKGLQIIQDEDTIQYKELYNDYKISANYFDSIFISNDSPCSLSSCFVYDMKITPKKGFVHIYYPKFEKQEFEFDIKPPFDVWLNKTIEKMNTIPDNTVFGVHDSIYTPTVMLAMIYRNNRSKKIYGDYRKFDLNTSLLYNLLQVVIKNNLSEMTEHRCKFSSVSPRDTFDKFSILTGIGSRAVSHPFRSR